MARNTKREYIIKLRGIEKNGYTFDIANYLYNPSYGYDYPSFQKKISETETTETYSRIYYFKHYDGTGEYKEEIYTRQRNGEKWQIISNSDRTEKILGESKRFNLNQLLQYCEA